MSRTVIPVFVCSPKKPRLSGKKDIRGNRSRRHFHKSSSRVMQYHGLCHVGQAFFPSSPFKNDGVSREKRAEATGHFSVGAEIRCRGLASYRGTVAIPQKLRDCYPQVRRKTVTYVTFMPHWCEIHSWMRKRIVYQTDYGRLWFVWIL